MEKINNPIVIVGSAYAFGLDERRISVIIQAKMK
jgi:hypothetical protein